MIKKISLLLGLTNVLSSTLNLTRTANYEQIICYKNLNCTKFLSTQLAPSLCECSDGTFFYRKNSQNPLECIKGTGDVANCSYHFKISDKSVQTNSSQHVPGYSGADTRGFISSIETSGVNCHSLTLNKVEILDNNMEWKLVKKEFNVMKNLEGKYYIGWKDPDHVNTEEYVGNIIKFNLDCFADYGIKISSCLLGKMEGTRVFNGASVLNDVCGNVETTQTVCRNISCHKGCLNFPIGTFLETTKRKPSFRLTVTTKRRSSTPPVIKTEDSVGINSLLPIIIGAPFLSVILIVFILLACFVWRRKKRTLTPKESNVLRNYSEKEGELYTLPLDPIADDNPSNLMGSKSNSDESICYDYPYVTAIVTSNSECTDNNKNDKSGETYMSLRPFSKSSYEALNKQVGLSKENCPQDAYVKMDG